MAKVNVAADNIQVRTSSVDENRAVLREIQAKKEVDARKPDELNVLFDGINAECASRSLKETKKALSLTSSDKIENVSKPVHYGPLPGYVPGKWWGIRMDCSRDCVHEPFNENIHDGPYGAVSICTSHINTHNDVDLGNTLTFTSREYSTSNKSKDSLVLSYKNRVPIRLVRSYCLTNKYAPKTGYRYDGLYTVVHHWIGVSADATRHHKFVLTRVLNQEPPPWVNKKISFKTARLKKSNTSRLTRSHSNVSAQESKAIKFVYNKVEKKSKPVSVSAIVSRQVFDKCISGSPDNLPKLSHNLDSANQSLCPSSCPTKLSSTNLSIRTNLYDSSHQAQNVKKTVTSVCKIFKPNQLVQLSHATSKEFEQFSTKSSDYEVKNKIPTNITPSVNNEQIEKKVKKVTWADACKAGLIRVEKSIPTHGNGFQYSDSSVIDGYSLSSRNKSCVMKYNNSVDCCPPSKLSKHKNILSTKSSDHISQVHSKSLSQNSKTHFSTMCESHHETEKANESSSIDSLAPDELVSVIVKEKYHPMAKLLIGNMIGLENQESAIVTAYNTLTSKVNQDDSKQPKENKLRSKFSIKNPSKKNGLLKKQRREIANLTIDAKFDTRSSRSRGLGSSNKRILKSESTKRKLLNVRRIQSRNKGIASRENNSKKLEKGKIVQDTVATKTQNMITVWTQCSFLTVPTVDQCQQTDDSCTETPLIDIKVEPVELVNLDDIKSESCDLDSPIEETSIELTTIQSENRGSHKCTRSAFAAVSADSDNRIARLRSIGFKPLGSVSPILDIETAEGFSRPDVDQEYNKYTSEENDVVGYMDEQLHFEDIEKEMSIEEENPSLQVTRKIDTLPQPIETLTEHDFDKPWHGWRKISINGQTYWTGC